MSKDTANVLEVGNRVFPTRSVMVKQLKSKAKIPTYGSDGAACFDFYACLDKDEIVVPAHGTVKVGTGLAFALGKGNVLFLYSF